jgi:hypothetical protein
MKGERGLLQGCGRRSQRQRAADERSQNHGENAVALNTIQRGEACRREGSGRIQRITPSLARDDEGLSRALTETAGRSSVSAKTGATLV